MFSEPEKEDENTTLLNASSESSLNQDEIIPKDDSTHLNLKQAFYTGLGYQLGTNVLLMSYTVLQLGILYWIICITLATVIETLCAYLLLLSSLQLLHRNKDKDLTRNTYPSLAEFSSGPIAKALSIIGLIVFCFTNCIAFILLAASTIKTLVPFTALGDNNYIRVCTVLIVLALLPFMYLGNYADIKLPAIFALMTSFSAAMLVLVNCVIYKYDVDIAKLPENREVKGQSFFVTMGVILFANNAMTLITPNVAALSRRPKKVWVPILLVNTSLYIILLLVGLTPYLVFGNNTLKSILSTFSDVLENITNENSVFQAITVVIQVLMICHLFFVSLLAMNPCYLYLEDFFSIKHSFNIQRVVLRTACMVLVLATCLLVPQFEFAIGLAGGVPVVFMTLLFPALIYKDLFIKSTITKVLVCAYLLGVVVFIVFNLVFSFEGIKKN